MSTGAPNGPPWNGQRLKLLLALLVAVVHVRVVPEPSGSRVRGQSCHAINQAYAYSLPVGCASTSAGGCSDSFTPESLPAPSANFTPPRLASPEPPSCSKLRDASIKISPNPTMLHKPLRLWPLVFLCAQSLRVWRPAFGLILALGLPQTQAEATVLQANVPTDELPNIPIRRLSYTPNSALRYSNKVTGLSVATPLPNVRATLIVPSSRDKTAKGAGEPSNSNINGSEVNKIPDRRSVPIATRRDGLCSQAVCGQVHPGGC
jgi:hypothetical protein